MGGLARNKTLDYPAESAATDCLVEVSNPNFSLVRTSIPVEFAVVLILDLAYFLLLLMDDVRQLNF